MVMKTADQSTVICRNGFERRARRKEVGEVMSGEAHPTARKLAVLPIGRARAAARAGGALPGLLTAATRRPGAVDEAGGPTQLHPPHPLEGPLA